MPGNHNQPDLIIKQSDDSLRSHWKFALKCTPVGNAPGGAI